MYSKTDQNIQDDNIMGIKIADNMKWISMIDQLTGGDITKDVQIYELSFTETMNRLSFWRQRDQVYKNRNKI